MGDVIPAEVLLAAREAKRPAPPYRSMDDLPDVAPTFDLYAVLAPYYAEYRHE